MLLPAQFEALGVLSGSAGRFVGMQLPDAACLQLPACSSC